MPLSLSSPDVDAIAADVASTLGGHPRRRGGRRTIEGTLRGHAIAVHIWLVESNHGRRDWSVRADVPALPLVARLRRKHIGESGPFAVLLGDPDVDATWTLDGAPREMLEGIVGPGFLERAIPVLARSSRLSGEALSLVRGDLKVGGLDLETPAVLEGIELAAFVLDRVKELVEERAARPPSPARVADEEALVAASEAKTDGWWSGKAPVVKVGLVIFMLFAIGGIVRSIITGEW